MGRLTCTRKIHFCSGHRVVGHENKCKHIHGHNYVMWITAEADGLDSVGRVIDFSVLKNKMKNFIDINWDHRLLMWYKDPFLKAWGHEKLQDEEYFQDLMDSIEIVEFNPTAENMANYLLTKICPKLFDDDGIKVVKVVLYETENCYAEASDGEKF